MSNFILKNMPFSRKIAYLGTFTAIAVLIDMIFYKVNLFGQNITFTPVVLCFISCWLGVWGGAIVAVVADFMSALIWGRLASYNPFFTLSAMLMGMLPYLIFLLPLKFKGGGILKLTLVFVVIFATSLLLETMIGMRFYYAVLYKGVKDKMALYYAQLIPGTITKIVIFISNYIVALAIFYPLNKISFLKMH